MPGDLYYGDNLDVMRRHVANESVDLVYLDPPFNSDRTYYVLHNGSRVQERAFEDTWTWDEAAKAAFAELTGDAPAGGARIPPGLSDLMLTLKRCLYPGRKATLAYLSMMAIRLVEMRRVLRVTGSLYLHCDPTESHYLKLILDMIFGPENFRSEIIWRRSGGHNKLSRQYGPIHDTILFYAKTTSAYFKPGTRPVMRGYVRDWFTNEDEGGPYRTNMLTGPGTRTGSSGKPWNGFDPTTVGRHWAIPASLKVDMPEGSDKWSTQEKLDFLYENGKDRIYIPRDGAGQPKYKQYVGRGVPFQDIWAYQPYTHGTLYGSDECIDADVKWVDKDDEKVGYQTQKPVGLLRRIIEASSRPGDVVLDPFCGCGTTVDAAEMLGRKWIGIDIAIRAVDVMKVRLDEKFKRRIWTEHGEPASIEHAELARHVPTSA